MNNQEHDKLCPVYVDGFRAACVCEQIAAARAGAKSVWTRKAVLDIAEAMDASRNQSSRFSHRMAAQMLREFAELLPRHEVG